MAAVKLLVDTDIFIDFFNVGLFRQILESDAFLIFYSVVTRKELLSKAGQKNSEKEAILHTLRGYRMIRINAHIAEQYGVLRHLYPTLDKEDGLIAATALAKKLPLVTRNWKHYRPIKGLTLFTGR
jgi:predicted nucleic acid-binding protein